MRGKAFFESLLAAVLAVAGLLLGALAAWNYFGALARLIQSFGDV
jgi:hypothetical protein